MSHQNRPTFPRLTTVAVIVLLSMFGTNAASGADVKDPVFDVDALASTPLEPKVLKTSEEDGLVVQEVQYHSHTDGAKRVDIFALMVYPKDAAAKGTKLPA